MTLDEALEIASQYGGNGFARCMVTPEQEALVVLAAGVADIERIEGENEDLRDELRSASTKLERLEYAITERVAEIREDIDAATVVVA